MVPEPALAPEPPPARRPRRTWRWVAGGIGVLLAGLVAGGLALGLSRIELDRPWIKTRLVAFVHDELGYTIDYEGLALSLREGIEARSLRLLTPPALAAGARDFVVIEGLDVRAPLWKLALGERHIQSLRIQRIELALVSDAAGKSTLSELFPEQPEPEPEQPTRPSQSLAELPELTIDTLELGALDARQVELREPAPPRISRLVSLKLAGRVQSGAQGLAGTELTLEGAPLRLEVSEGAAVQHAQLRLSAALTAAEAQALALRARLELLDQDLAPAVPWHGELLGLDATARFDAAAGTTQLSIARLGALSESVTLAAQAQVFDSPDNPALRVVTSGTAHVALPRLPLPVQGVGLDGLTLEVSTRELSWDGARVLGALDMSGGLRRLDLDSPEGEASVQDVTLAGRGGIEPSGGRFSATVKAASLGARAEGSRAQAQGLTLALNGSARELGGAQQFDAELALASERSEAEATGNRVQLGQTTLRARASASALDLAARAVPVLSVELGLGRVDASGGGSFARLDEVSASASVDHLVADATAELGAQGDAKLLLQVPRARVYDGVRRAPAPNARPALDARDLDLQAALPLTLARAQLTLALGRLVAGEASLQRLALEAELSTPLALSPERDAAAGVALKGRVERFDVGGGTRGGLDALSVQLQKPARDRYHVELDARSSTLAVAGLGLPGGLVATLRSDADLPAGSVQLASTLRGQGGATLDAGLDARFDRASERLTYSANLNAEKLEEFAALVAEVEPRASRVQLAGARLAGSARGELSGLLRAGDPLPELVPRPLGTLQGSQSAHLELTGLDYRGPDRALRVPRLELELESTHRAAQGGNASAQLSLPELALEGGGTSLRLKGLTQKLLAKFERAPDQGMVDVRAALNVGSAAQSWAPGFPVRDLSFTSNVQIDRLRSIYLRELVLANPASGSALRAAGTLELLGPGTPGGGTSDPAPRPAGNSIAGREALSFEGRLEQELGPLEKLQLASHASGRVELPFRLESGGLLGYRLIAALEAKQVALALKDGSLAVEGLNGAIPVLEEFALLDNRPVISAGPRTSPLSDTRFFDVHPFLTGSDYVTAESLRLGGFAPLGPLAANVRLERSDFIIDQLQTGYQGGQIVGQVRVAYRDGDPIVRLRLNATGVRSGKSRDVFDANTALTFVPAAMTLDGKMQIVRASREHLEDILDVLDPFHESANANRVRRGLTLGYPKFVRFQLHDGAVDTKVELGGIAQLVRIDEIKAVPLGPILQKYVAPALSGYFTPAPPEPGTPPPPPDPPLESASSLEPPRRATRVEP